MPNWSPEGGTRQHNAKQPGKRREFLDSADLTPGPEQNKHLDRDKDKAA
jgi:hypothetical protein